MRLEKVRSGHRLGAKLKMTAMRLMSGRPAPDVVRALLYRPELFGTAANELFQAALRGPSRWSVGERELFASFVSNLNRCRF